MAERKSRSPALAGHRLDIALYYRWAVLFLFLTGLYLLYRHGILTLHVLWSRSQYYTITTILLFLVYQVLTVTGVDIPFLYTADCRYAVTASLYTLFVLYHLLVAPGAIRTHRLNDIAYEHYSFYNFVFHYIVPQLVMVDWLFFVDKSELHWQMVFLWLIYPILYVGFVYLRAWLTICFHGSSNLYPYLFMDPNERSLSGIIAGVLTVGAEFFGVGLFCYILGIGARALGL